MYKVEKVTLQSIKSDHSWLTWVTKTTLESATKPPGGDEMLEIVLPLNADNDKAQGIRF